MQKLTEKQISLIKQRIPIDEEMSIVRLDVMGDRTLSGLESSRNVYCINNDYEILWQIQAKPTGFESDPFVNVKLDNDELFARNFSGFKYKINLKTGDAKEIGWDK